MSSGVTQVSVAPDGNNVCAIKSGALYCWGDNTYGQVGDGTTGGTHYTPTAVTNLSSGVTQVASGADHTCAVASTVGYCWGDNSNGQLGNNKLHSIIVPTFNTPFNLYPYTQFSVNKQYTCAVMKDINNATYNDAYCWGLNTGGQLGTGNMTEVDYPSSATPQIGSATNVVTAVSSGNDHACALAGPAGNKPFCWGNNNDGEIGDGTTTQRLTSVAVSGSLALAEITAGGKHTCGDNATASYCWGSGALYQLDNLILIATQMTPLAIQSPHVPSSSISAGASTTCLIHSGSVVCFGDNTDGQLGQGYTGNVTPVSQRMHTTATAGGASPLAVTSCQVTYLGSLYCWGSNTFGQLGNGTTTDSATPVAVTGMTSGVTEVAAGSGNVCAVKSGSLYCWGSNAYGQLADGTTTNSSTPLLISGLTNVVHTSVGSEDICAIAQSTTFSPSYGLWCWGTNAFGEIGVGTSANSYSTPQQVSGFDQRVISVSAGGQYTCAQISPASSGTLRPVYCWGRNQSGQVGNGAHGATLVTTPTLILSDADMITTGAGVGTEHACALNAGTIECWGANSKGQVGNNSATVIIDTPTTIATASDATTILASELAAGDMHTCAFTTPNGSGNTQLYCWGDNEENRIGLSSCTGTGCYHILPTLDLTYTASGASHDLAAGYRHTIYQNGTHSTPTYGMRLYETVGPLRRHMVETGAGSTSRHPRVSRAAGSST